MKNIAVIDVGSNSIRFILVKVNSKAFTILDEIKEMVRLGADMGEENTLKEAQIEKAVEVIKLFKKICDGSKVQSIIATATEAVRRASNGANFIDRIKAEVGIEIKVLSGDEEAYYDYLATSNSLDIKNSLIMDVGGCSTELIWQEVGQLKRSISIPIGALNTTQKFELYDDISVEKQAAVRKYIFDIFRDIDWLLEVNYGILVGIGGTFRNIGKMDSFRKGFKPANIHNYRLKNNDIKFIFNTIRSMSIMEKRNIKGLSTDRADIFGGGILLVNAIIDYCSIEDIVLSRNGLREGLVYEFLHKA